MLFWKCYCIYEASIHIAVPGTVITDKASTGNSNNCMSKQQMLCAIPVTHVSSSSTLETQRHRVINVKYATVCEIHYWGPQHHLKMSQYNQIFDKCASVVIGGQMWSQKSQTCKEFPKNQGNNRENPDGEFHIAYSNTYFGYVQVTYWKGCYNYVGEKMRIQAI